MLLFLGVIWRVLSNKKLYQSKCNGQVFMPFYPRSLSKIVPHESSSNKHIISGRPRSPNEFNNSAFIIVEDNFISNLCTLTNKQTEKTMNHSGLQFSSSRKLSNLLFFISPRLRYSSNKKSYSPKNKTQLQCQNRYSKIWLRVWEVIHKRKFPNNSH